MIEIIREELKAEALIKEVACPSSGALALFLGVARQHSQGKKVVSLEYEAYEEMAIKTLAQIAAEIKEKWAVDRVAMSHRVGPINIGETSIIIAVSAPHRKEALQACQYAIDRVKEIVPIWKKELFEDGSRWVGWGG